jgi:hypothetical protein
MEAFVAYIISENIRHRHLNAGQHDDERSGPFFGSFWGTRLNNDRFRLHLLDGLHRGDACLPVVSETIAKDFRSAVFVFDDCRQHERLRR